MADVTAIISQTQQVLSTTGILTSAGTALASNPARGAFVVQNLGTNPLFVKQGAGASSTDFNVVLKGASVADDGTGGIMAEEDGRVYTGIITVGGTSPRFVATEW